MILLERALLYLFILLIPVPSEAFEIIPVETQNSSGSGLGMKIEKSTHSYPRALSEDVVCGKPWHVTRFSPNRAYASLSFSVLSKKMTQIKVSWDNPEFVVMPYADSKKTVVFPHAGGVANLYVNAYQPISGSFYIKDMQGNVLKECPYSFLPPKQYRQSLSFNVGESRFTANNNFSDNVSTSDSLSVNYQITPKPTIPEGVNWSFNAGVSQHTNESKSQNIYSSFTVNW